jgi:hypothetical protein
LLAFEQVQAPHQHGRRHCISRNHEVKNEKEAPP